MTGVALEADREREKTPPPHMAALLTALPQTEHQTWLAAASPQSVDKESCGWVGCSLTELSGQLPACPQPPSPGAGDHHAVGFRSWLLTVGTSAAGSPVTQGTMLLR